MGAVEGLRATGYRKCPCCRQKLRRRNPHKLCGGKIQVLDEIGRLNAAGFEWVFTAHERRLVTDDGVVHATCKDSRVHTQRLFYFGLLDYKGPRTGLFKINREGIDFLCGRATRPRTIWCREGRVVSRSKARITVDQAEGVVLDRAYWDDYARAQR